MIKKAKFYKVSFKEFSKSCDNKEIYDAIKLPKRATKGSAGYDFYAPYSFVLAPGETVTIPTGIRVKMNPSRLLKLSLCFLDLYLFYKTILVDFFGFFYVFIFFVLFFML